MLLRHTIQSRVSILFVVTTLGSLAAETASAQLSPMGANLDSLPDAAYPVSSMVIDVTKEPYNARGDGLHDDTVGTAMEFASKQLGVKLIDANPEVTKSTSYPIEPSKFFPMPEQQFVRFVDDKTMILSSREFLDAHQIAWTSLGTASR